MKPLQPKRWNVLEGDPRVERKLCKELRLHPMIAHLLVCRGIASPEDAEIFLNPSLDRMHDPFLLPDVNLACDRLKTALAKNEKILVHGDYDGDGVTSAALWTRTLRSLGADVDVFVPHRKRDGYDMRVPIIEQAREQGVTLIVTTDCGIQRVDEVEHARQYGIDVIITDHHTPGPAGSLPQAVAVINPQRADSKYPFRHLAGVGVAFKVCEALTATLGHGVAGFRRGFLDLASIGTVTDVMPLVDENRIIVKHGLEALTTTKKPGLRALITTCGFNDRAISAMDIGFGIGPRLNAASRIDETQIALDLLMTKDPTEADRLASRLNDLNDMRRDEQKRIFDEAMEQVARQDADEVRCLVVSGKNWSAGIVGIVASKITDKCHRPAVVIALDSEGKSARGSARSISAFHLYDAIHGCRDLLVEYGGHAHAAGLSIEGSRIEEFAERMNEAASKLTEEQLTPTIDVDAEVHPSEVTDELLCAIETMAPFGSGNPEPRFVSRGVPVLEASRMGSEKQHLRLTLRAEGLNGMDSVQAPWWRYGDLADHLLPGTSIDLCYRPTFNVWNRRRRIQFMIEDLQPADF